MRGHLTRILTTTATIVLGASMLSAQFKVATPPSQQSPSYPPQYGSAPYPAQQPAYPATGPNDAYATPGAPEPRVFNDQDPAEDQQHGVARISVLQGDVNVRRG